MKVKLLSSAFLLFLFLPSSAFSDVYKWVDEDGNVHFGDKPPESNEASQQDIEVQNISTNPYTDKSRSKARERISNALHENSLKRQSNIKIKEEQKTNKLANKDQCLKSRILLAKLSKQMPTYIDNKGDLRVKWKFDTYQGERKYLNDNDRDAEFENAKKLVNSHCVDPNNLAQQEEARLIWAKSEHCLKTKADFKELIENREFRSTRKTIEYYKARIKDLCE